MDYTDTKMILPDTFVLGSVVMMLWPMPPLLAARDKYTDIAVTTAVAKTANNMIWVFLQHVGPVFVSEDCSSWVLSCCDTCVIGDSLTKGCKAIVSGSLPPPDTSYKKNYSS